MAAIGGTRLEAVIDDPTNCHVGPENSVIPVSSAVGGSFEKPSQISTDTPPIVISMRQLALKRFFSPFSCLRLQFLPPWAKILLVTIGGT